MKTVKSLLPLLAVAALLAGLLTACGGGGASLKSNDVAAVGSVHVTKSDFDALLTQAKQSYAAQTPPRAFPKQGTTAYQTVKGQAVGILVQQAEREAKAKSMGIKVSDSEIQTRLDQIKKQYFGGSEKRYQAQLKQRKLTDAQVRNDIREQLISEKLFAKVTGDVKVSDKDVHAYYIAHPQLYSQERSRDVRHILVKSKSLAESLYSQLKAGNDKTWCTLAKKYSQDPSSKDACGKLTVSKGQTVPEFDAVAFGSPTKQVHVPVHSKQYGWFVIEPLTNVKPRSTTPEKQVATSIRQTLLQQKKNQAMNDWVSGLSKSFCSGSKIKYQVGYSADPDPCAATTTAATTTG
jgi:parvulin-like peptidyl-prolyl isomerase